MNMFMPNLARFAGCLLVGLLLSAASLPVLMLIGRFDWIAALAASGKPLAHLALVALPGALWESLSGVADAAHNPDVRSFLELCTGVAQSGLLLAVAIYRLAVRK